LISSDVSFVKFAGIFLKEFCRQTKIIIQNDYLGTHSGITDNTAIFRTKIQVLYDLFPDDIPGNFVEYFLLIFRR
jgi:hypothetical protein